MKEGKEERKKKYWIQMSMLNVEYILGFLELRACGFGFGVLGSKNFERGGWHWRWRD